MHTISIVSQKGGAGKTTLAIHPAGMAAASGYLPCLIDLDPQATASAWSDWRRSDEPDITAPHTRLSETLAKLKDLGADIAIIDTPPHADAAAVQAARASDIVLIPCRPQAFDLHAMRTTADLIALTEKPAFAVLNGVPVQGTAITAEARDILAQYNLPVADAFITNRAAYRDAVGIGKLVFEMEPIGSAAREIEKLWQFICAHINIPTTKQEIAA
ncbi:MAG: AAA family ATPase [Candidatus Acidiferrales bacterium]